MFRDINRARSKTVSTIPTTHEPSLDHALIGHLADFSAPFRFASKWIVTLETHFLGGAHHWGRWEIADLGVLIMYRRAGTVLRTKVALLQSKRLYPDEIQGVTGLLPIDFQVGFGRLFTSDSEYRSGTKPRTFTFTPDSLYRALEYASKQYNAVLEYAAGGIPVHYHLYNPVSLPWSAQLPASANMQTALPNVSTGCRVINAQTLDAKLQQAGLQKGRCPSFRQIGGNPDAPDVDCWTLEDFIADMVIGCKEGYVADANSPQDHGLHRVFSERSAPISAALSITIDAPEEAELREKPTRLITFD